MTIETKAAALRRLHADGYDATEDGGGGYAIWHGRDRVGRVFSLAGLFAWRPEAEPAAADDHGVRPLPPARPPRAPQLTPPMQLHLPGGVTAEYIPESDPPQYTIAGHPIDVDVTIPDDLARAGWFWLGSTLVWRDPTDPARITGVATSTFPPPGWSSERVDCFEAAREIDPRPSAETVAAKPAPAPKTKRAKAAPTQYTQETMQL